MADFRARLIRGILGLVTLGSAGCCAGLAAARLAWFAPAPVAPVPVHCDGEAPEVPRGTTLRVLVWNAQYAAGRGQRFFYDGGNAVSVSEHVVRSTLDGIAEVVRRTDPDFILWQELDHDSRRTGRIDEIAALRDLLPGYPCAVDAPYHKAPYVPFPPQEHLGRVDMRLAVWSRYRIASATRYDLPRLDESWIRQQFNLKRALLEVALPIRGGGTLVLFDTHLSAFSRGDGTLPRQLAAIAARLDAAEAAGHPWVLGADLNALPAGDDPSRLTQGADLYDPISPLTPWYDRYASAVPLSEHAADPQPYRTWMPWGSEVADRAIDHVFYGGGVEMHGFSVLQDVTRLSDHHPLIFDFAIP